MIALCVLLPLVVPVALAFALTAVDLVRQDERVTGWWAIGLGWWVPLGCLALVAPLTQDGMARPLMSWWLWAIALTACAAALVLCAIGLSVARGLRPGGETTRRIRTSVAATLGLLALAVGSAVAIVVLEQPLIGWSVPAAWAGLVWVIAVNRRGPERLERGRRAAAEWLALAGVAFGTAAVHVVRGAAAMGDGSWWVDAWLASALVGVASLIAALRVVAGPLSPVALGLGAAIPVTLFVPEVFRLMFQPVPRGVPIPVWEDLRGRPPDREYSWRRRAVMTSACVVVLPERPEHPRCDDPNDPFRWYALVAADPSLPVTELGDVRTILVDDGRWMFDLYVDGSASPRLVRTSQGWRFDDRPVDDEGLIQALQGLDAWGELPIARTPELTLQDFVRVCVSAGTTSCKLVDALPDDPLRGGEAHGE